MKWFLVGLGVVSFAVWLVLFIDSKLARRQMTRFEQSLVDPKRKEEIDALERIWSMS